MWQSVPTRLHASRSLSANVYWCRCVRSTSRDTRCSTTSLQLPTSILWASARGHSYPEFLSEKRSPSKYDRGSSRAQTFDSGAPSESSHWMAVVTWGVGAIKSNIYISMSRCCDIRRLTGRFVWLPVVCSMERKIFLLPSPALSAISVRLR